MTCQCWVTKLKGGEGREGGREGEGRGGEGRGGEGRGGEGRGGEGSINKLLVGGERLSTSRDCCSFS